MPYRPVPRYPLPAAASLSEACEDAARQLISDILFFHAVVTLPFGGVPGLLSPSLLDSAAHRPFAFFGEDFVYATGLDQAGALLQSLVQNHVFEDGNKRTAITTCLFFLECCGYWKEVALLTERESMELEELTLLIAIGRLQVQAGRLQSPLEPADIGKALEDILGPSRNRRMRQSRIISGLFRQIGQLFIPKG